MKRCMKRLLFSLLVMLCMCVVAEAESFDFFEEALHAKTVEELSTLADAHGIALSKAPDFQTTYMCEGVSIGGVQAYMADVYIHEDASMSLPLAYFLVPEEEKGSSLSPSPGKTYEALMEALTARYGAPYMTAITILARDSLWFFDGVAVRLGYLCVLDGSSYMTLEYLQDGPGIGSPAIIGFKPGEAVGEAAELPQVTGTEYIDRLTTAAKLSGQDFQPTVLVVEMGECSFLQTSYGKVTLNVTTETQTGRVTCVAVPLKENAEAALAACALMHSEQDMRGLENLISWGEDAIVRVYEAISAGYICLRDGDFCYSIGYDDANNSSMLLMTVRNPVSQPLMTAPKQSAQPTPTPQAAAESTLTPAEIESWGIGCSAILTSRNALVLMSLYDPYLFGMLPKDDAGRRVATESLADAWSCNDREKLIETILRMTDGGHNARFVEAYDLVSALTDEQYEALLQELTGVNRYMWPLVKSIGDRWGNQQIKAWDWFRMIHLAEWGYIAGYLELEEAYGYMIPIIERLRANFSSWEEAVSNYMDGYAWWSRTDVSEPNTEYRHRMKIYDSIKDDVVLFNPLLWGDDAGQPDDQID